MTALLKNPRCKFLGISTAAHSLDSPLGRMRTRALAAPDVKRTGPILEAGGHGLKWLEWSLAEDTDHDDLRAVTACNPLRTLAEIREQRPRVTDVEWLQFHCCRWGVGSARWLPPGAWARCRAVYEVGDEPLALGVDVGGSRSPPPWSAASPAKTVRVDVALVEVWQGADAVLKASAYIEQLVASGRAIREIVFDPMRFSSEALRLEAAHGIPLVEWPQSESRMTICSERLHGLVVEQRLRHPSVAELDRHVANAQAKPTPRGWRLTKSSEGAQIDALISLAMAAERASQPLPAVKFHGWL